MAITRFRSILSPCRKDRLRQRLLWKSSVEPTGVHCRRGSSRNTDLPDGKRSASGCGAIQPHISTLEGTRIWSFSRIRSARAHRSQLPQRSEEHTSELQSLMRISYAVFCLKKKKKAKKSQKNKLQKPNKNI